MKNTQKNGEFNGKQVKYTETENQIIIEKTPIYCKVYDCKKSNTAKNRYKVEILKTPAKKHNLPTFICHVSSSKVADNIANTINTLINKGEPQNK
jgi:hypothetical protein